MITIAIPYYRGLNFLKKAVESVLNQDSPEWRLVIHSDGPFSPEDLNFLNSLKDPRITWLASPAHLGMVQNWNTCLELATHPWITLLHSDDELLPSYVSAMHQAQKRHPMAAAIFCQARIIDEHSRPVFSFPDWYKTCLLPARSGDFDVTGEQGVASLLKGDYIFCPTLCYNLQWVGGLRFDPRWKMVQDLDFKMRLLLSGKTLVGLSEEHYAYRRHFSNATVTYTQNSLRFNEEWELHQSLAVNLREHGWVRASKIAAAATIIKLNLTYCLFQDLLRLRGSAAASKTRLLCKFLFSKATRPAESSQ